MDNSFGFVLWLTGLSRKMTRWFRGPQRPFTESTQRGLDSSVPFRNLKDTVEIDLDSKENANMACDLSGITGIQDYYTLGTNNAASIESDALAMLVPASSTSSQDDQWQAGFTNCLVSNLRLLNSSSEQLEKRIQEVTLELKNSKERPDSLCQLPREQTSLSSSPTELQHFNEGLIKQLLSDLKEKIDLCKKQTANIAAGIQKLKIDSEKKLRCSQEEITASATEVQRLKTNIEEKQKGEEEMKTERSQLMTEFLKLQAQLTVFEQKAAQESLNSGSYLDDHANPRMLQDFACKNVDSAIEALAKLLHNSSITRSCSSDPEGVDRFVRNISPASPACFSRTIQLKYIWSYWICFFMFQRFEDVFFDVGYGLVTSPLDAKRHIVSCFQSFHKKKDMSSSALHEECKSFREFCQHKYALVFPQLLIQEAFHSNWGREIADEVSKSFLEVAKAVWLLHQLAFSFDPPATILRMSPGEPFDKQFHESVIHDEDNDGSSKVVLLMIRPAFRVRKTIIRSRVVLSMKSQVT